MTPLFKPGDLLCVRHSIFGDIRSGDVVIVCWGNKTNRSEYVVHRVNSVKKGYFITQGDNNLKPDGQVVAIDNLVGLVTSFGRQNQVYSVRGGYIGFLFARFIHARNYSWLFVKRLGWRIYRHIRQSGWVARVWCPTINQILVKTDDGPLIKYCYGSHTVAHWRPEKRYFAVVKPFDLVISNPNESK